MTKIYTYKLQSLGPESVDIRLETYKSRALSYFIKAYNKHMREIYLIDELPWQDITLSEFIECTLNEYDYEDNIKNITDEEAAYIIDKRVYASLIRLLDESQISSNSAAEIISYLDIKNKVSFDDEAEELIRYLFICED